MNRRQALLAGMTMALGARSPALAQQGEPLPLWRAAARAGILFGAAGGPDIFTQAGLRDLHLRHSRLFVHENAMKLGSIRPVEGTPRYDEVEALLTFAEQNGMLSQGTALIWNDANPAWLSNKSSTDIGRLLDTHLEATCTRFYGRFHSYGVVNEPIYPAFNKPNGYRDGPFYAALGEDYIFRSYKRVAAVDPSTKLFLNEAWCEHNNDLGIAVRKYYLTLIDKMQDRGLKLDAIGLQAHLQSGEPWDPEAFARFLEELSKRKLKIWLTEFDVDDQHFAPEVARRDAQVAELAGAFFRVALANRDVEMLVPWGLCDKNAFLRFPAVAKARGRSFDARSLPFDDDYREKPVTRQMRAALLAAPARS
jgi:endo-1,4-beta-xylanase